MSIFVANGIKSQLKIWGAPPSRNRRRRRRFSRLFDADPLEIRRKKDEAPGWSWGAGGGSGDGGSSTVII